MRLHRARHFAGAHVKRMFADMDAWGYSFRLGSSRAWFENDAEDASLWLQQRGLIDSQMQPAWRLRDSEAYIV